MNRCFKIIVPAAIIVCCCMARSNADTVESGASGGGFWESVADFFLPHPERRQILCQKETQYFQVTVEVDGEGRRHLVFNPNRGSQGIWNPNTPDALVSNYCRYTAGCLQLLEMPPRRVLFIGLGAGLMPRFVRNHFPDTQIDIIEIDAAIPAIAERYFGFRKDGRMAISIGDGRDFINRTKNKYDIIFIDAYNAECVPFQLTTVEFYRRVRASLNAGGVMTANLANLGKAEFIAGEIKTVRSVFPEMAIFVCAEQSNYILYAPVRRKFSGEEFKAIAAKNKKRADSEGEVDGIIDTMMTEAAIRQMIDGAEILRDDFAPVETLK